MGDPPAMDGGPPPRSTLNSDPTRTHARNAACGWQLKRVAAGVAGFAK